MRLLHFRDGCGLGTIFGDRDCRRHSTGRKTEPTSCEKEDREQLGQCNYCISLAGPEHAVSKFPQQRPIQ
jgi:hypothetical protein